MRCYHVFCGDSFLNHKLMSVSEEENYCNPSPNLLSNLRGGGMGGQLMANNHQLINW